MVRMSQSDTGRRPTADDAATPRSHLLLVGMPGAGKSTVGRHLARILAVDFIDLDRVIEARSGASIPTIFEHEGESGFRRRESQALDELTAAGRGVIATGGGVVLDPENRELMKRRGLVVFLAASFDELRRRLRGDRSRPLLNGDDAEHKLAALLAHREPLYRECAALTFVSAATNPRKLAQRIAHDSMVRSMFADPSESGQGTLPTMCS